MELAISMRNKTILRLHLTSADRPPIDAIVTAFFKCAETGFSEAFSAFFDLRDGEGALFDVNVLDSRGRTALSVAGEFGQVECVRVLLAHPNIDLERPLLPATASHTSRSGASLLHRLSLPVSALDSRATWSSTGMSSVGTGTTRSLGTALHAACKAGHLDCVELLLQRGSRLDAVDFMGRSPLAYALHCLAGFPSRVADLIRLFERFSTSTSNTTTTTTSSTSSTSPPPDSSTGVISSCSSERSREAWLRLLNARDATGLTLLHVASRTPGFSSVLRTLLECGASARVRGTAGNTAALACAVDGLCAHITIFAELTHLRLLSLFDAPAPTPAPAPASAPDSMHAITITSITDETSTSCTRSNEKEKEKASDQQTQTQMQTHTAQMPASSCAPLRLKPEFEQLSALEIGERLGLCDFGFVNREVLFFILTHYTSIITPESRCSNGRGLLVGHEVKTNEEISLFTKTRSVLYFLNTVAKMESVDNLI